MSHESGFHKCLKSWFGRKFMLGLSYFLIIPCIGQIMPKTIKVISTGNFTLGGSDILQDKQGNYWFTGRSGMFRYNGQKLHLIQDHGISDSDYAYYNASLGPDDKLWLSGTNNRILSYVDLRSTSIMRIPDTTGVVRNFVSRFGTEYLFANKSGIVWICLKQAGLVRFDPKTSHHDHIIKDSITITKMTEDIHGNLWGATLAKGVFMINPQTRQVKKYQNTPLDNTTLTNNATSSVFHRQNGEIWVGLDNYIDMIEPSTNKVKHLRLYRQEHYNGIRNICEDSKGNVYFAHGRAVYRYNDKTGLQRLDLIPTGRYALAMYIDKKDHLWIGNAEYVTVYDLNRLRTTIDLNIVDIDVNGNTIKDNDKNYSLTRDENGALVVSIREGDNLGLHYSPKAAFQSYYTFKARLKKKGEVVPDWVVYQGPEYFADFHLPRGSFTFEVSSQVSEGQWKDVGYLRIIVISAIWKRWWAICIYIILALIVLLLAYRNHAKRRMLRNRLRQQQLENEVWRQVDETKMHFFSNIAHEFRTPLTLILNAAEYVETSVKETTTREKIFSIQRNTFHVLRLVNQILDLTKKDAGKLKKTETLGDPIHLLAEIIGSFKSWAEKKQLMLIPELSQNEHAYYFDHAKIETIMYNLLSNAIKFTPEGGKVIFSGVIASENLLIVKVTDTGIGIEYDMQPRIFDRFYQFDSTLTREFPGTGLGLAVVKEFTELLGGSVEVSSIPHKGTSFTVQIPIKKSDEIPKGTLGIDVQVIHSEIKPDRNPATLLDQPLVVVVEDHDELRSFLIESLRGSYQVVAAKNGQEGIKIAQQYIPDLIISDVMMPLVDGYELIKTLKNDLATGHIPILILSAKSSFEDKLKGLEYGADAYLTKPFSLSELLLSVNSILLTRKNLLLKMSKEATTKTLASPEDFFQEREKLFLSRLKNLVLENLGDESFDIGQLAEMVQLSRSQLYRKIHALTQQTASQFIHAVRLEKARELLLEGKLNVTQVAAYVGYSSQSYFSQMFREHFGHPPKITNRMDNDDKT